MYYGPRTEMCETTLGRAAGAMVFDAPLEISFVDQLLRNHQNTLMVRLAAHKQAQRAGQGASGRLNTAEVRRASEQLTLVNRWLEQLTREDDS